MENLIGTYILWEIAALAALTDGMEHRGAALQLPGLSYDARSLKVYGENVVGHPLAVGVWSTMTSSSMLLSPEPSASSPLSASGAWPGRKEDGVPPLYTSLAISTSSSRVG
jgi:hypothetical protein